jgi:hypothetical protein
MVPKTLYLTQLSVALRKRFFHNEPIVNSKREKSDGKRETRRLYTASAIEETAAAGEVVVVFGGKSQIDTNKHLVVESR